jgi:hypothetical protein
LNVSSTLARGRHRCQASRPDPELDAPINGRDEILEALRFCPTWAALDPQLQALFGDGRQFCAGLRVLGVVTTDAPGIPSDSVGRSFAFAEAGVFQVADGQIARMSI